MALLLNDPFGLFLIQRSQFQRKCIDLNAQKTNVIKQAFVKGVLVDPKTLLLLSNHHFKTLKLKDLTDNQILTLFCQNCQDSNFRLHKKLFARFDTTDVQLSLITNKISDSYILHLLSDEQLKFLFFNLLSEQQIKNMFSIVYNGATREPLLEDIEEQKRRFNLIKPLTLRELYYSKKTYLLNILTV